ncbi:MAG: retroviral-like aspartic protease family protein [Pyrinomonadaceae bacterium]
MTIKLSALKLIPRHAAVPQAQSAPPQPLSKGEHAMGLVYADIEVISGDDLTLHAKGYIKEDEVKRINISALVDSGAYMLSINERVKNQLGLRVLDKQFAEFADGRVLELEVVGPIEIRFENRRTTVDAMVLPGDTEILLGSIPMEDMDVLIDPKQGRLIVNPAHPYVAQKHLK